MIYYNNIEFDETPIRIFDAKIFSPLISHLRHCISKKCSINNSGNADLERALNYKTKTLRKMIKKPSSHCTLSEIDSYISLRNTAIQSLSAPSISIALPNNISSYLKNISKYCYEQLLSNSSFMEHYNCSCAVAKNMIKSLSIHDPRCPYCDLSTFLGGGNVRLDHYIPHSKIPELAIAELNIVPACNDCNSHYKGSKAYFPLPNLRLVDPWSDISTSINPNTGFFEAVGNTAETRNFIKTIGINKKISSTNVHENLMGKAKAIESERMKASINRSTFKFSDYEVYTGYHILKTM